MSTTDTVVVPKIAVGSSFTLSGWPSTYSTGGFVLDLTSKFAFLRFFDLAVDTNESSSGNSFRTYQLNVDSTGAYAPGKVLVKIFQWKYKKGSVSTITGNPSGTSVAGSATQAATTTGSSHNHSMDHNHPNTTSGTPSASGVGVATTVGGINLTTHTHDVDLPNFTGNTSSTTHTHQRSFEYKHSHPITTSANNLPVANELANGTSMVGSFVSSYLAIGD